MKFIKDLLKRISDNYITFFKDYLLTNIVIMLSAILTIIFLDEETAYDLFKYELFFAFDFFTVETLFKDKKKRIIGYIIAAIISFIFGFILSTYEDEITNYLLFYLISLPLINLFSIIKNRKEDLAGYLHQFFSRNVSVTIINCVLNIGVFLVLGIIDALLIPDTDFDLYLRVEVFLLGFFTIPSYLYAVVSKEGNVTELANALLKYVILPLTYIAYIVIYLYIGKIIITQNIPSNVIYSIVFALFIESIPMFIIFKDLNLKNRLLAFIDRNISFIFLPLWLLQVYSLLIRINDYGLTKSRYLGIMVLIIEIICLVLMYLKNRKYLPYILYVIVIISGISFVMPIINYESFSIRMQANYIDNLLKNKKISELDHSTKKRLYGAYRYLQNEDALDQLHVTINENEIDIIDNIRDDYFYETYDTSDQKLNIEIYKSLEKYEFYNCENGIVVIIKGTKIDLNDLIKDMLNHKTTDKPLIFTLDENHDFYLIKFTISGVNGVVNSCNGEGYILTK